MNPTAGSPGARPAGERRVPTSRLPVALTGHTDVMIAYTSRTGTRTTLTALRDAGWRLLVTPAEPRTEGMPYALDNGAWSAYQAGTALDLDAYWATLDLLGAGADFAVVPDVVAGGEDSLELTFRSMRRVLDRCPRALLAVQDGVEPWQVDELLGERLGVFVGGTTAWKLQTLERWAAVCRARGAWCHVGRVNTSRRIALCGQAGATSFDGTSPVRFPSTLARLDRAKHTAAAQVGLRLDDGVVQDSERPWWDGP